MTLHTKRESVRRAARNLLLEGKRVQLIVGPLNSQSQIQLTVRTEDDIPDQLELAFAEMRRNGLPGIKVRELTLSSE